MIFCTLFYTQVLVLGLGVDTRMTQGIVRIIKGCGLTQNSEQDDYAIHFPTSPT